MNTRADYFKLTRTNESLFTNPAEDGIEILLDEAAIQEAETHTAQILEAKGLPPEWAKVGIAYRDQYLLLLRDAVRFPDKSLGTYIRLVDRYPGILGVVTLPVYQGQILLIRHFRHATRSWHLEIPRGFGTVASTEDNARRELEEEIGATISRLTFLGDTYPDTGMVASRVVLFYAEVAAYGQPELGEAISDIFPTPPPEFERLIRENKINDGFTLAAYARAKAFGLL